MTPICGIQRAAIAIGVTSSAPIPHIGIIKMQPARLRYSGCDPKWIVYFYWNVEGTY